MVDMKMRKLFIATLTLNIYIVTVAVKTALLVSAHFFDIDLSHFIQ